MDGQPVEEFDPDLHRGQTLTNDDIRKLFRCSGVGSMRRAHQTNSLVLISGEAAGPYHDRWAGGEFHFTGRGLKGDQDLDEVQNRTLAQSTTNGVAVFHFDNPNGDRYVFTGRVRLTREPYTERQPDEDGVERQVWMFPLEVVPAAREAARAAAASPVEKVGEGSRTCWQRFVAWLRRLFGRN